MKSTRCGYRTWKITGQINLSCELDVRSPVDLPKMRWRLTVTVRAPRVLHAIYPDWGRECQWVSGARWVDREQARRILALRSEARR